MSQAPSHPLEPSLEAVVRNASNQLESFDKTAFAKAQLPLALLSMLVIPAGALVAQLVRITLGFAPSLLLPWWAWVGLTVVTPLAWVFGSTILQHFNVARSRALQEADERLEASERLQTADSFLRSRQEGGFAAAAIEDASDWASRGQAIEFTEPQHPSMSGHSLWPFPATLTAFVLVFLLSRVDTSSASSAANVNSNPSFSTGEATSRPTSPEVAQNLPPEPPPSPDTTTPQANPRSEEAVNRQGSAGAEIPDTAEESAGKLSEGETRESQQSANPSNAKGSPSASGQPSKQGEETARKRKQAKKPSQQEQKKKPREQEDQPSGATAGQGSSQGSDNNAAPSDWSSTSQAATPDDEEMQEEDEVDDEEEEQESRGGVQPNMRDRRAPVNRDLQIGFGNNRPNPDANGRGGPGGQKKSRGVASLVLGVPIPDRVNGQPNKGRIRITQQRITPETETSQLQPADSRPKAEGDVGRVYHPQFTPWMQDYVRRYFLEQRAKSPLHRDSSSPPSSGASPSTSFVNPSSDSPS